MKYKERFIVGIVILIILIPVMLITQKCNAQLQVSDAKSKTVDIGEAKAGGSFIAKLYYIVSADTTYVLMFKNAEYQTLNDYQDIDFSDEGGTLDKLYSVLKSAFSDENKKNKDFELKFKLGTEDVILRNERAMGFTDLVFYCSKGYFYLSERQLDKLFGK